MGPSMTPRSIHRIHTHTMRPQFSALLFLLLVVSEATAAYDDGNAQSVFENLLMIDPPSSSSQRQQEHTHTNHSSSPRHRSFSSSQTHRHGYHHSTYSRDHEQSLRLTEDMAQKDHALIHSLIEWVRENDGIVSPDIELKRVEPDNPNARYGVFAKRDMPPNSIVFQIPRDLVLGPDDEEDITWICDTHDVLMRELDHADDSDYAPYIHFLQDYLATRGQDQNPSIWSLAGKSLLLSVVEGTKTHTGLVEQVLPPDDPVGWIDDQWRNLCFGEDDPYEHKVLMMILERGSDHLLVPLVDFLAHRNGPHYLNTNSPPMLDSDGDVMITTSRRIRAGEELYTTYNLCEECGARLHNYGTPEILRDYGFVEDYPQKWIFHEQNVAFTLDHYAKTPDEWRVEWSDGRSPSEESINFFEQEYERLQKVGLLDLTNKPPEVPEHEWIVIRRFHNAITNAIEQLLEVAADSLEHTDDEADCTNGSCILANSRYAERFEEPFDMEGYEEWTCDITISMDWSGYDSVENRRTSKQDISVIRHPETRNTCYALDNVWSACTSYRAHFYEMLVHYAARFVDKMERILVIGGGNSMVLHELMKYSELDLVVVLEADQTVTRTSFKYFGAQPMFDNPKVQWYFGDISKSLTMLPSEYFGSFDLIIADEQLSDEPRANGFNLAEIMSMLLNPTGIFVKDEVYLEPLTDYFKYTMQMMFYDVPVICSQMFILGSQNVNFLEKQIRERSVETMVMKRPDRFKFFHDFFYNPSPREPCLRGGDIPAPNRQQETGFLMILEAEHAGNVHDLESARDLIPLIQSPLEQLSCTIRSTKTAISNPRNVVINVILDKGYILARTWPKKGFASFDIQLWRDFDKASAIQSMLLKAVGSTENSSYRLMTGGMHSSAPLSSADLARGPRRFQECPSHTKDFPGGTLMAPSAIENLIHEATRRLVNENPGAAMSVTLCGNKKAKCSSHTGLANGGFIEYAFPLYTCPKISGGVEFLKDANKRMYECETQLVSILDTLVEEHGRKIDVLVLDSSAPHPMAQILHKILTKSKYKKKFFASDLLVLAPIEDPTDEWRRNFVDTFRTLFLQDPVYRAELYFNSTESSVELGAFLAGESHFFEKARSLANHLEIELNVKSEIRRIEGGVLRYQKVLQPSHVSTPQDFPQKDPFEQWKSQTPMGYQTLFQFQLRGTMDHQSMSAEKLGALVGRTLKRVSVELLSGPEIVCGRESSSGCTLSALWARGSAIFVWDGQFHMDVNLFTFQEDELFADHVLNSMQKILPGLKLESRDILPRGYGKVVNFASDVNQRWDPLWAPVLE